MPSQLSVRSAILTRRSYCRPLDEEGTRFESFGQVLDRVIAHQRWLWERAQGEKLSREQEAELAELRSAMDARRVSAAGRTLWLGGTDLIKRREASSFNCSYIEVRTVHDVVDVFWNLLQGCGVGFKPIKGALFGFTRRMEVEVIRSAKTLADGKGREESVEAYDPATKTWSISVGDSAEAWAKLAGKLVAGKHPARKLVIDLSEVRAGGSRLKGYGWICSGDGPMATAIAAICEILNRRAGQLLSKNDIVDVVNWLGTVLSSRRSAEIALLEYGDSEWREFATRKPPGFDSGPMWFRGQSNNSLLFWDKPTKRQLRDLFDLMIEHGGGEPGIINGRAATARAPWFGGLNPCAEILLAVYGFCNLSEIDLAKYRGEDALLARDSWLLARMNYRQTLVNLRDGVLQDAWHQTNENLRLCGVGVTGIARRPEMSPYAYRRLRSNVVAGAYSMADELGLPRPGNVTTIKPSGTLSKAIFDTTEGAHKPKARHIFNNVNFSRHDPLVPMLLDAGYRVSDHPNDATSVLVTLPVSYADVPLDSSGGYEVDREPAVAQMARYKMLMDAYCDQNVSITVSYDPSEVKDMVDWLHANWDSYVAMSFLFRNDVTKTARDLGFAYLPQETVTREEFDAYTSNLRPVDADIDAAGFSGLSDAAECEGGACPVR